MVKLLENQGAPVELMDLFENPTLAALADLISARTAAGTSDARSSAARQIAYWDELAATAVPALLDAVEWNASAPGRLEATVTVPVDGLLSALAIADQEFGLREVLLTALGVSLRMWSGASAYRWIVGEPQRG